MSQPKRYICTRVLGMFEMQHAENGDWIYHADYAALAAENERLRSASFVTAVPSKEYERLKAENERLRKEADGIIHFLSKCESPYLKEDAVATWNAIKEGAAK